MLFTSLSVFLRLALLLLERGAHLGGLLGIHVLQTLLEHGDLLVVLGLSGFLPCARIERGAYLGGLLGIELG